MPAFVQSIYLVPDGGAKMEFVEAVAAVHLAPLVETSTSLQPTECTRTVSLTRKGAQEGSRQSFSLREASPGI
jgi:hypothetical protein